MKTYQELLAEAKGRVKEIGVQDAFALRHTTGDAVFLDVREPQEYNLGKIPGAVTISRGNLEKNVESLVPREKSLIVYCAACPRDVVFNVDRYPASVPVPAFGPHMVCTGCGMIGADARPNWQEHRPSGAWR